MAFFAFYTLFCLFVSNFACIAALHIVDLCKDQSQALNRLARDKINALERLQANLV